MKNIPLIIPNFNQLTYLKNLINWWQWYNPYSQVFVVDNGSTYDRLLSFYESGSCEAKAFRYKENNCIKNLRTFIDAEIKGKHEYYVISDPDIMPHPSTPLEFL